MTNITLLTALCMTAATRMPALHCPIDTVPVAHSFAKQICDLCHEQPEFEVSFEITGTVQTAHDGSHH